MIYFAHRGASALAFQNTVESFASARQLGAAYYELDVHLTRDGQVVVHHDYSLLSTAGQAVQIGDLTWAELSQIPLVRADGKTVGRVPLLSEVLPIVRPALACLNIELKNDDHRYPDLEQKTLEVLAGCGENIFPKILFSSFDQDSLARMCKLNKNARMGLLTRSFDVSKALGLSVESVHLNYTRFTPAVAQICHEHQLKVYLYTVNDKALAEQLSLQGADGIFTDRIDLFV